MIGKASGHIRSLLQALMNTAEIVERKMQRYRSL
jgi:hypothetical protein